MDVTFNRMDYMHQKRKKKGNITLGETEKFVVTCKII